MIQKQSPLEKELKRIEKKEQSFLKKNQKQKSSILNQKLEGKVPEKLQSTLDLAFSKAFRLIFEKGTNVIEKTYSKKKIEFNYKLGDYALHLEESKKNLRSFSKNAGKSNNKNLLITSVEGIGLGILGIGIPDIPIFTAMILKSIYEIAISFGYSNDTDEEKYFILLLIQGAFLYGKNIEIIYQKIDDFINLNQLPCNYSLDDHILETANLISKELLYAKFLQGIPIAGILGGAENIVYLNKIVCFSKIKYHKRYLLGRQK